MGFRPAVPKSSEYPVFGQDYEARAGLISGDDRSHRRLNPDCVHDPGRITFPNLKRWRKLAKSRRSEWVDRCWHETGMAGLVAMSGPKGAEKVGFRGRRIARASPFHPR